MSSSLPTCCNRTASSLGSSKDISSGVSGGRKSRACRGEVLRCTVGGGAPCGRADCADSADSVADAADFHAAFKAACDRHDAGYYPKFKEWCDRYFYLPHRGERRGVGGLFFDHEAEHPERWWQFVQDAGRAFLPAWLPIADAATRRALLFELDNSIQRLARDVPGHASLVDLTRDGNPRIQMSARSAAGDQHCDRHALRIRRFML